MSFINYLCFSGGGGGGEKGRGEGEGGGEMFLSFFDTCKDCSFKSNSTSKGQL